MSKTRASGGQRNKGRDDSVPANPAHARPQMTLTCDPDDVSHSQRNFGFSKSQGPTDDILGAVVQPD
ncbi:hypothetical protein KM043_011468 [Ampulex compressa]|nr:hypothetical protein KM043_011468 [Ampulex compressa]